MAPHEASSSVEGIRTTASEGSVRQHAADPPASRRCRGVHVPGWCVAAWQWGSGPLAAAVGSLALWGAAAAAVGAPAWPPSGQLFALAVLAAVAAMASSLAKALRLPELVGPLAAGALLRSVGVVHLQGDYQHAAEVIRKCALAVILIRAGLGLDPSALRRLFTMVLRLAVVPSAVEAGALAAAAHFLLGLPWMWGAMTGAMMAAVSPAVVIPALFRLQEQGFGADKGIPTLVVAAASLDDVIAVTTFGILYGVVFAGEEGVQESVIRGVVAVPMGVAFGALWGTLLRFVPRIADEHVAGLRTLMVAGGGLLAVLGSNAIGFEGAGPLGAILAAFVAAHAWRSQGWNTPNPVTEHFRLVWTVFQILLFALIGAELDLTALQPLHVALGLGILFLALAARIAITVFIAFGAGLTWKEKLFLSFAWLPKATVQAALGPAALDAVRRLNRPEDEPHAQHVLTLAALAILLTAPAGAALLAALGPRLLRKAPPPADASAKEGESSGAADRDPSSSDIPEDGATQRGRCPDSEVATDIPLNSLYSESASSSLITSDEGGKSEEENLNKGDTEERWSSRSTIERDIRQDPASSHL